MQLSASLSDRCGGRSEDRTAVSAASRPGVDASALVWRADRLGPARELRTKCRLARATPISLRRVRPDGTRRSPRPVPNDAVPQPVTYSTRTNAPTIGGNGRRRVSSASSSIAAVSREVSGCPSKVPHAIGRSSGPHGCRGSEHPHPSCSIRSTSAAWVARSSSSSPWTPNATITSSPCSTAATLTTTPARWPSTAAVPA